MTLHPLLCRLLLPAMLAFGMTTTPAVRADIIIPRPRPDPKPPKPQPPLPPEPKPIPDDDDGVSRASVVAAVAASVGMILLGVWVVRRSRPVGGRGVGVHASA
jgi:hypothetical protein